MKPSYDPATVRQQLGQLLDQVVPSGQFMTSLSLMAGMGPPDDALDPSRIARRALARFRRLAQQGSTVVSRPIRRANGTWRIGTGRQLDPQLDVDSVSAGGENAPGSQKDKPLASAGFLSLAVYWNDMDSLRWAMRCGLNPNRYDPSAGSMPVGQAAYTGNIEAIRLFWAAGADLTLLVTGAFGEPSRLHGSTLLHRLMEPGRKCPPGVGDVAAFLIEKYPDPLVRDVHGRTFLDWAGEHNANAREAAKQARDALAARQAREAAADLQRSLPDAEVDPSSRFRL